MTPVRPPIVKRKIKPRLHNSCGENFKFDPWSVAIQLNTFTPVGMAMIIVAAVK